ITSPPRPPSPPSGPPFGTNFSRRKLTLPRPPLPACAKTLIRSTNIMRRQSVKLLNRYNVNADARPVIPSECQCGSHRGTSQSKRGLLLVTKCDQPASERSFTRSGWHRAEDSHTHDRLWFSRHWLNFATFSSWAPSNEQCNF